MPHFTNLLACLFLLIGLMGVTVNASPINSRNEETVLGYQYLPQTSVSAKFKQAMNNRKSMIVKMALQHGEQGMAYADVYPRGLYAYLLAMPHTTGTKATGPTVSGDTEYVVIVKTTSMAALASASRPKLFVPFDKFPKSLAGHVLSASVKSYVEENQHLLKETSKTFNPDTILLTYESIDKVSGPGMFIPPQDLIETNPLQLVFEVMPFNEFMKLTHQRGNWKELKGQVDLWPADKPLSNYLG